MTGAGTAGLALLRRLAYLGARHGPAWWLEWSPGPIGLLAWVFARAERGAVKTRLGWVLGRAPTWREVALTFTNFAHCLAEMLGASGHPPTLDVSGLAELQRATRAGRGVILMTAHTGAWEFAATRFRAEFDCEVVLVMRAEGNAAARNVHERARDEGGVRAIYVGSDPFVGLALADELRRGNVLAFQLDRGAPSGRGIVTHFFGRGLRFPEGPLRLARSTGAPVVSGFCRRQGFLHHCVELHAPLVLEPGCSAARLLEVAQAVVSRFEAFVSRYPLQWFDFELADLGSPPNPGLPMSETVR